MKGRKTKSQYSKIFDELKPKEVNLRSCDFLFKLFLRAYPVMKLNESDDWEEWTSKVLTFFADLGNFYEYEIYLKPGIGVLDIYNEKTSEYLVDLCWAFADQNKRAAWIELALESELSGRGIDSITYDFGKLTDVKAYTKVGIFAPMLKDKDEVLEEIVALVGHHEIRIPTEKYLIILLLYHGKTEVESKRIEIAGYEINYLGDVREIVSERFPDQLRRTRTTAKG